MSKPSNLGRVTAPRHHTASLGSWKFNVGRWMFGIVSITTLAACDQKSPPPFKEAAGETVSPLADMLEHPRFAVPAFTLTERSGQPFDSATTRGKVWVADFFFATCPGICAALSSEMQKVHTATKDLADVRLVSISTDEKDTPEVLRGYAQRFSADDRWAFLTGKKDVIFKLSTEGFKLVLADNTAVDAKEQFIHSGMIVLVDRGGRIRGYYDAVGPDADKNRERLLRDLKRVHAEPEPK